MKSIVTTALLVCLLLLSSCQRDFNPFPISELRPGTDPNTETGPTEETTCTYGAFWYDWSCYADSLLWEWGFGRIEKEYIHSDRNYSWYIDQGQTGEHSGNNCGPSSVAMAAKWHDESFTGTAEEARELYPNDGGWWYTSDIVNYFDVHTIPYLVVPFTGQDQMKDLLLAGNILLLCIDTQYIARSVISEKRVGRFYAYAGGHFLLIKGYRGVDDTLYFEVYDPNNWYAIYRDGSQKGKNRHYHSMDVSRAITNWWNYLVIVYPQGTTHETLAKMPSVDPDTIAHKWGR